jgi:transposase-like protein
MERIPNRRYTKEFREEAVKLVKEGGLSIPEVSRRLDLPKSTIENWLKASRAGKLGEIGKQNRQLSDIEIELANVKRELAKVKMERDILKKSGDVLREGVDVRCAMIEELRLHYPIKGLCELLELSESSYYSWRSRAPSQRAQEDARLALVIRAAHKKDAGDLRRAGTVAAGQCGA